MDERLANALGRIVEIKDRSTGAHTWRVAMYAQLLAESADLAVPDVKRFMLGAVLHDLGKLDVPEAILAKPGRLTDEEYEIVKSHTTIGWDRLRRMGVDDPMILNVVRHHHERIDGSGYPDRLAGADIPLEARWFGVIDAFDAMTSLRPYRDEVGSAAARRALRELRDKRGTWYPPEAVDALNDLFEAGRLESILEHLNDPDAEIPPVAPLGPEILAIVREALQQSNDEHTDIEDLERILRDAEELS